MIMKKLTTPFIVALISMCIFTGTTITVKASSPKTVFHIVLHSSEEQVISTEMTALNKVYMIKTVQEWDITEGTIIGSMIASDTIRWNTQSGIAIISGSFVITTDDGNIITGRFFALIRDFTEGPMYFELVRFTFVGHGFMNIEGTISFTVPGSIYDMAMDGYSW